LTAHSVLATVTAILGLLALRFVYKRRFANHAKIGRVTAPLWFVTAGTGLVVFLLLYVIFPPGPNVQVFKFAFGN
jgi:putative membrane protein